ncbi:AAWKG family protein [Streptomyces sp. NPDC005799]|uniref:AAWKG family protein n=1 Tax=Streptomyces sp. NPDC005799 TaxID=3154678 RepID=UPI0033E640FA
MATESWEDILHLLTGWSLVRQSDVTDVSGDSGIPWVNISIQKGGHTFDDANDAVAWVLPRNPNKGFHFEFFSKSDKIRKWRVEVTYIDSPAFHRFWGDSDGALTGLLSQYSSVKGDISVRGDGAPTSETEGVQLKSFAELAWSFDAAGEFFKRQTAVLDNWRAQLGSEQASWKGNAAGAFWHLVDDLHTKYENYTSELQPPGFSPQHRSPSTGYISSTLHGDDLIGAEQSLYKSYSDLHNVYSNFVWQQAQSITTTQPDGSTSQQQIPADPLDVLNQVMVEVGRWIIDNNSSHFGFVKGSDSVVETRPGFSEVTAFGALTDTGTWHAMITEAVNRWSNNVHTNLDANARQVLAELKKDWSRVLDPSWNSAFSFTDTPSTLTSNVQQETSDKSGNSLNDTLNNLGKGLDDLGGGINDLGGGINDLGGGLNDLGNGLTTSFNGLSDIGGGLGNNPPTVIPTGGAFADTPSGSAITDLAADGLGGNTTSASGDSTVIPTGGAFGDTLTGNSLVGDGSTTTPAFGSGLPISNIDGSTTVANGTGVTTTYPNGNTVTRNSDGSITSTFADGTSRTVAPDGTVTTVDAQGDSTTSHLGVGESLSNPDGTSITRNADGSLTQTAADGTKTTTFSNGTTEITTADGATQLTSPDGTVSHLNADGSLTTDGLNGAKVTVHPNGDVTTVDAQGHSTTTHLDAGKSITNPDGSTVTVDSKGNIVTHNPDGSTTTLHRDGTVTTTQATPTYTGTNGNTNLTTPHIDIPTYSGGGTVKYTPDGTTITSHPGGVTQYTHTDGSGLVTTSDGRYQSIPSPQVAAANQVAAETAGAGAGTGTGATAGVGASALTGAANTDGQSAMGLLSPMMMMAGMNRMGGQQGGQGGGDRERNLYDGNDMDGAVIQHGMPSFGGRAAPEDPEEWEEEETDSDELLGPRRPSTESGYGVGGGARQSTQSAAWSGKDKDVWGTEEGGLPASIGH